MMGKRATANTAFPLAGVLTETRVQVLANGLVALEGALRALQQPLPEGLEELKEALSQQEEILALTASQYLTTGQVAKLLNCSPRKVLLLGEQAQIKPIQKGGRGRGRSNTYETESVYAYLERIENKQ